MWPQTERFLRAHRDLQGRASALHMRCVHDMLAEAETLPLFNSGISAPRMWEAGLQCVSEAARLTYAYAVLGNVLSGLRL